MLGLGSIIGTGVFVSLGIGISMAGPTVLPAIALAGLVAMCNGLNSAQLAANHSVSGGTYEYGHRWLNPSLGFIAGWMFLCAKSASAATARSGPPNVATASTSPRASCLGGLLDGRATRPDGRGDQREQLITTTQRRHAV